MSDFRNANDPLRRDEPYDLNARSGAWGWIAGAVVVVILLALAFGIGRGPNQAGTNVASNNSPMTHTAPAPSSPAAPAFKPAPTSPAPQHP
jgi:hypothetical protein